MNHNLFIIKACAKVKKNKNINVSLISCEFYGISKYGDTNVYKVIIKVDNDQIIFYTDEDSFVSWRSVAWSGQSALKTREFYSLSEDKQLFVAWCWCIYKYSIDGKKHWAAPSLKE